MPSGDRRRLVDKLVRELLRCEVQAIDHPDREARRLGEVPPVVALRAVAAHAMVMRPRLSDALEGHELVPAGLGLAARVQSLRRRWAERIHDPAHSYRGVLLELRHGLEVVRVLRDAARLDELFAVIRWCDDWAAVRRTLVACAEARLAWFARPFRPSSPVDPLEAVHKPGGPAPVERS